MLNHNRPKVSEGGAGKPTVTETERSHEEEVQRLKDTHLTPTEDLIMEVLAARDRLGEPFWPFSTKHRAAIRSLSEKGFVNYQSGNVENTLRVGFLNKASREAVLSPSYVPPLLAELEKKERSRQAAEVMEEAVRRLTAEAAEKASEVAKAVKAKTKKAKKDKKKAKKGKGKPTKTS